MYNFKGLKKGDYFKSTLTGDRIYLKVSNTTVFDCTFGTFNNIKDTLFHFIAENNADDIYVDALWRVDVEVKVKPR